MPWVRALLRSQKVFARADEDGRLVEDKGRVEIRYKPNDGRRYGARVENLQVVPGEVLPEETCGPAEVVEKSEDKPAAGGAGGAVAIKKIPSRGTPEERKAAAAAAHAAAPKPPDGHVIAYADGACTGNPGPSGLGVVVVNGDKRVEISEYLGLGTNNIAELTAILRALGEVPERSTPMTVYTDSKYSIGVLQQGWKAKANTELIANVKAALKGRGATKLVYVPGHSGVALNERADELARDAVSSRRSKKHESATKKSESETR